MPCQRPRCQSIDADEVLTILSDDYAMEILSEITETTATAAELTDRCSGSKVTIYRRLNRLEAAGLVRAETKIRSDGNHCHVYQCAVSDVTISLTDDGFEATIDPHAPRPDDRSR